MILLHPKPQIHRRVAFLVAVFAVAHALFGASGTADDPIRVLTIGNSFARDATFFLPDLGESAGVHFILGRANLGGASLERHARHLAAWQRNPDDSEARPYRDGPDRPPFSLVEALQSKAWDYVTVQQVSINSFKPDTYEPYASQVIAAVRQYAPMAEVLVHETWAYRRDSPLFADGTLTQEKMYQGLRDAYDELAQRYGLRVIPVGDAFHLARRVPPWHFPNPDPNFDYENPPDGAVPEQSGSLNVGWHWATNRETGAREFRLDANHASIAGRFLGACVFFEVLSGRDAREVDWQPPELDSYHANTLRDAAHRAVVGRKPEKGFVSIFDGRTLNGWDGDPKYWRVENGAIVGEVTPETILKRNSFLIWRGGTPANFELKAEYRVSRYGNSGLSYRNVELTDVRWSLSGYQADIDGPEHDPRLPRQRYSGQTWEERGRRFLARRGQVVRVDEDGDPRIIAAIGDPDALESALNNDGWNDYHVIARGNLLVHIINGQLMSMVIDDDPDGRRMAGLIGVQVHIGPPQTIEYRNIRLKVFDD